MDKQDKKLLEKIFIQSNARDVSIAHRNLYTLYGNEKVQDF